MNSDVIVVGGGIIGCSIALELSLSGLKVTVIERGRVGCEASRAAAGMLSPQAETPEPSPLFDLCYRSRALYPQFAALVKDLSGIDPEYRDEGTLCVSLDEADASDQQTWASWQIERGLPIEPISSREARQLEPAISESAGPAFYISGDHQIENRRLMDGLAIALERTGVELIEGAPVESVIVSSSRATGVTTGGRRLSAEAVVVAAGCWSSELLAPLGIRLEVVPARGQMVAVAGDVPVLSHVVYSDGCYLVPRRDNRILIGSTIEYVGYKKGVTPRSMKSLLGAATRVVPAIADLDIVETWSGLRPDSPDHLPVLGPSGIEKLLVATGHFRSGVLLAPITAKLLGSAITDGAHPPELEAFSVQRFCAPAR